MLPRKYIMFLNLISVTLTFISVCLAGTQYSLAHAAGTLYFLDPAIESYNKSDSDKELHLIPNVSDPFSSVGGVTVDGFIVPMQQYSGPGIYKSTCSETKTLNSGDILREDADEEPGPQPAPPQDPASAQPPIEEPTPPQQADPPKKEIDYTDTTLDYSGSTYTGGSTFIQPVESKNISTVRNAGSLAEDARARELIESDKASMDIPSPKAGVVRSINMKLGDKVSEGDVILTIESSDVAAAPEKKPAEEKILEKPAPELKPEPKSEPAKTIAPEYIDS